MRDGALCNGGLGGVEMSLARVAGVGQMQENAALRCLKGGHNWEAMGKQSQ